MADYIQTQADTYLRSGSNELKILEYTAAGDVYGINILKVNRVLAEMDSFRSIPDVHPAVRGVFNDHDRVIPLLDLGFFLGGQKIDIDGHSRVIVTEFFGLLNGFLVDRVETVHTLGWDQVINAQNVLEKDQNPYVISIVRPREDQMILLLDYETIILELMPNRVNKELQRGDKVAPTVGNHKILIAEDSSSIRDMLSLELEDHGFEVLVARDGREAHDMLMDNTDVSAIVTDVEMPHMDGLALTKAVKENAETAHIPVIVYSSIGDIGMKERAKFLQAEHHITKLNMNELLEKLNESIPEVVGQS